MWKPKLDDVFVTRQEAMHFLGITRSQFELYGPQPAGYQMIRGRPALFALSDLVSLVGELTIVQLAERTEEKTQQLTEEKEQPDAKRTRNGFRRLRPAPGRERSGKVQYQNGARGW